jgi:hypothetical protein
MNLFHFRSAFFVALHGQLTPAWAGTTGLMRERLFPSPAEASSLTFLPGTTNGTVLNEKRFRCG